MQFKHKSVMLDETINSLDVRKNLVYVDGTLGGAGHSKAILDKLNGTGMLIGIDRDEDALKEANEKLKKYDNKRIIYGNHDDILEILQSLDVPKVDGILMDLGVSSYQLDEESRGFSYMKDSKLDMRMDKNQSFTAYDVINDYPEEKLKSIFKDYGEEKYSVSIAKNICEKRKIKKIETTFELVDIIKESVPKKALTEKQHPAKRVFQAIRIEVNDELSKLSETVKDSIKCLNDGGRLVIITFHSLEDRIVKHAMEEMEGKCTCPPGFPVCVCGYVSYGKVLTKKPIIPSDDEINDNPRSRSAKVRVFLKKE